MMMKSTVKKERSDIFKLINFDYQYQIPGSQSSGMAEKSESTESGVGGAMTKWEKLEIEHSQTYIGYKLMWVMKMFLEGKKFP